MKSKKPFRKVHPAVEPLDQATDSCANLTSLSDLLESCSRADVIDAKTVARVGAMMGGEARRVQDFLRSLQPGG